jgi:hypothetical protein
MRPTFDSQAAPFGRSPNYATLRDQGRRAGDHGESALFSPARAAASPMQPYNRVAGFLFGSEACPVLGPGLARYQAMGHRGIASPGASQFDSEVVSLLRLSCRARCFTGCCVHVPHPVDYVRSCWTSSLPWSWSIILQIISQILDRDMSLCHFFADLSLDETCA